MVTVGDGTCMEEATKRTAAVSLLLSSTEGEWEGHILFHSSEDKEESEECVDRISFKHGWFKFGEF